MLDKYVIGKVLGQGGFGITYIAFDMDLRTRVCIKEFFPQGAMRDATHSSTVYWNGGNTQSFTIDREYFYREARSLVGVRGVNSAVTVWNVFKENGTAYIVMDYVEGVTLKTYLRKLGRPLDGEECFTLFSDVMQDLGEIHKRGIIHRDIKPDNLMVSPDGKMILLDWGSAKDLNQPLLESQNGQGAAQPSQKVVTHGFSPIEQYITDGNIGAWTDVYAMCAVIVYCMTGKTLPKSFDRLYGKPIDLSTLKPELAAVLEKGLAIRDDERIQTMDELHEALRAVLEDPREKKYQNAKILMMRGDTASLKAAKKAFEALGDYKDSATLAEECGKHTRPKPVQKLAVPVVAGVLALGAIGYAIWRPAPTPNDAIVTSVPNVTQTAVPTETVTSAELLDQGIECYKNGDYKKAMEWYQKAADAGSAAAMCNIGYSYKYGLGVTQDYAKAMEWYQKAADAGSTDAMNNIGNLYRDGLGVTQDYAKAMEWYQKAADAGNADAMCNIGYSYKNGLGVTQDYTKAMEWYQKAADAGSAAAMNNIGILYRDGIGVTQDYAKAMEWYQKAADAGHAGAMNNIGDLYRDGFGVTQNYAKAMEWYQKAADAGHDSAMCNIGVLYEKGRDVTQDYAKAMEWYEKAADAGNATAMNNIGILYKNGRGVTQDYAKAMEWYQKAADAGHAGAMNNIGFLYEKGHGVTQDYAKAMEWYEKAADAGSAAAMNNIGILYEKGHGVTQDYAKAMEWYQKAADAGNATAMNNIGILYKNGRGVTQDYARAMEWFQKAADAGNAAAMHYIGIMYRDGLGVEKDQTKADEWAKKATDAGYTG